MVNVSQRQARNRVSDSVGIDQFLFSEEEAFYAVATDYHSLSERQLCFPAA